MKHWINLFFIIVTSAIFFFGFALPWLFSSHSDIGVAGGLTLTILIIYGVTVLVANQISKINKEKE